MSWHLVEREDVRVGDVIRLVVPNVLSIAEGSDGRPAFGYGAGDVYVERFTPDPDPDPVGAALAEAGVDDLRRGIPLSDYHVQTDGDRIRITGTIPTGLADRFGAVNLAHLSLVRPDDVDEAEYSATGELNWRRTLLPSGVSVTTTAGDLPRCSATDIDEGVCIYAPHSDHVPHAFTMSALSPQIAEEPTS